MLGSGFRALLKKEFLQLLRNKQLLVILVITPIVQLMAYGLALSPEVKHLRLGVLDYSCSPASRDLLAELVSNEVFDLIDSGRSEQDLAARVRDGDLDAGIVIGPEFARELKVGKRPYVQVLLDGVDANTAGIASAYVMQIVSNFNSEHAKSKISPDLLSTETAIMFNPGLVSSWFFVPGVIGMVLNIAGILVSSATLLREKETGTLEQLLMTPVSSAEILIAKIIPLLVVLFVNIGVSLSIGMGIFHMPFRGNPLSLFLISLLYIFVVMSIGIALATISANQRQAMLISFFITMPVIQLSGALAPLESMPEFFRIASLANPLRYYIVCLKGVLLKGVGLDVLWPQVLALFCFAFVLLSLSASRFRKQMA
ncbi:MAG: ABC transporter permease [Candidatus Obscuribacterales bacterium]|nr:ABC transporter permease [Candidatus Obscuribacterales bacterium]